MRPVRALKSKIFSPKIYSLDFVDATHFALQIFWSNSNTLETFQKFYTSVYFFLWGKDRLMNLYFKQFYIVKHTGSKFVKYEIDENFWQLQN